MRHAVFGAIAGVGLIVVSTSVLEAQDAGWWGWALEEAVQSRYGGDGYDRYDRRDRDDRSDRYRRSDDYLAGELIEIILGRRGDRRVYGRDRRSGGGPPFCRSGRGHPVHGRAWCREKGWDRYDRGRVVWDRRGGWGDIILRNRGRYRHGGAIDRSGLIDILGDVIFARLARDARLGRGDLVSGRWLSPYDRGSVLQVRSGARPVAELSDVDGDGRVDAVLIPRR
jgi:hypothetical protein